MSRDLRETLIGIRHWDHLTGAQKQWLKKKRQSFKKTMETNQVIQAILTLETRVIWKGNKPNLHFYKRKKIRFHKLLNELNWFNGKLKTKDLRTVTDFPELNHKEEVGGDHLSATITKRSSHWTSTEGGGRAGRAARQRQRCLNKPEIPNLK